MTTETVAATPDAPDEGADAIENDLPDRDLPDRDLPDRDDADEPESDIAVPPDYSDLLTEFEDTEDLDDGEAGEVETGLEIDEDAEEGLDGPEALLDIGDLVPGGARASDDAEDDAEGEPGQDDVGPTGDLTGLELATGLEGDRDLVGDSESTTADDGEGAIEPLSELVSEELPALDDGNEEAGSPLRDELPLGEAGDLAALADDDLPRPSELPWVALLTRRKEPHHLVVRLAGQVLSAGSRLVRLDDDDAATVVLDPLPAPLSGLVSEPDGRTFLCASRRGSLFRVRSSPSGGASEAEPVLAWRDAVPDALGASSLQIGGPTPAARPALLLLLAGDGILLESTDQGTTFRRVDLGGRVLALSSGTPPLCVVETSRGTRAMRSEASGGFRVVGEGWPADAEGSRIATNGDVVAVLGGRDGEGVHVSADGGVTFRRALGSRTATAVIAGRLGGRPSAFAALYAPASGRTTITWIDAATGESLGIGHIDGDDDDDGDPSRVTSLAWDPATETLWAATPGGLRRFRRPASA